MNDVVLNLKHSLCRNSFCFFAAQVVVLFFVSSLFFAALAAETSQTIEPDVTIISKGDGQIAEYRSNGRLYMVKVTPAKGPVYYLLDSDGDGTLETRRHHMAGDDVFVPRWKVLQWK